MVVRDKQGRILNDLHKEDFTVVDNRTPRAISGFTVEQSTSATSSTNSALDTPQSTEATLPDRILVFLFDDLHLSFEDMAYAKKAGVMALSTALGNSDAAAVVSTSGKINSGVTEDRAKLQSAMMSLQPHLLYGAGGGDCPRIEYYQADLIANKHDSGAVAEAIQQVFNCNPALDPTRDQNVAELQAESAARRAIILGDQDIQATFATTREIIKRMANLPGQRLLILVSPGFLTVSPEGMLLESQLIDLAAQSNVAISTLDARGLYSTELGAKDHGPNSMDMNQLQSNYRRSGMAAAEGVLGSLAYGTGGTFFHNNNDLNRGLKMLTEIPSTMYLLELPLDTAHPGYHRLSVRVDREGSEVEARVGYFVQKPAKHRK